MGKRLHRKGGCKAIRRVAGTEEPVWRNKPARPDELCRFCFPEDPVRALLAKVAEEERLDREAQRLADETAPGIVAMLVDMTKGE